MPWLPIVLSIGIVLFLGAIEELNGTRGYYWQDWHRDHWRQFMLFSDVPIGRKFERGIVVYLKIAYNKAVQILSDGSYGEEFVFDAIDEVSLSDQEVDESWRKGKSNQLHKTGGSLITFRGYALRE